MSFPVKELLLVGAGALLGICSYRTLAGSSPKASSRGPSSKFREVVVWGVGELGTLFAGGALRLGLRVVPIRRHDDGPAVLRGLARPCPVFVCVGEGDLGTVLAQVPPEFRDHVVLVQNELFPSAWQRFPHIGTPTVCVVWAVVKRAASILVSPRAAQVCGPLTDLVVAMHASLRLDVEKVASPDLPLVLKYAYILAINTLGLRRDVTLGEWLSSGAAEAEAVATDAVRLACALLGPSGGDKLDGCTCAALAREVTALMATATVAGYRARGRTAEDRLARARAAAAELLPGVALSGLFS
jgi:hypothetical protein